MSKGGAQTRELEGERVVIIDFEVDVAHLQQMRFQGTEQVT
jgi:hypothetical protein